MESVLTLKVKEAECDLYFPESIDDVLRFSYKFNDYYVLAGGSNIIAGRVRKPVLFMGGMVSSSLTEDTGDNTVKVFMPASATIGSLIDYSVKNGLSGLEFMAGIPGTVGGAVYGNATPAGNSWAGVTGGVHIVKGGEVSTFVPKFSYRKLDNVPEQPFVIYGIDLILLKDTSENVRKRVIYYISRRINIRYPSAGSLFKNPGKEKAGVLLDKAGLKGYRVNDAALSENHANIVINRGKASYLDFEKLFNHTRDKVKDEFNIKLEPEVKFWND